MSVEENKALVRRYFEEIDETGDVSVLDRYVSPGFVDHYPAPGCTPDLAGLRLAFEMFRTGSPGPHRLDDVIAEGDKVVVRVTGEGVHSGELFGIPPTNRHFTATGITILRIAGGKIVERWAEVDMLGCLQQLGVIPDDQSRV
jgi:ketosteroid isomerase-like protein